MNKKKQIKSFFYVIRNRDKREKELNDFLSQDNIIIDEIFQSSGTNSVYKEKPEYLDVGVIITIVYHYKK